MDDSRILELYMQRDEQAVELTKLKYGSSCLSLARSILSVPEDAEECLNDALLNAWNSIPPQRPRILGAFLHSLTRCAALKKWRAMHARKRGGGQTAMVYEELGECLSGGESVELHAEAVELAEIINSFLRSLPEDRRRVFVCRYWYCDSIEAIAARFGFSSGKVKSMLFRTRSKLADLLKKEGVLE